MNNTFEGFSLEEEKFLILDAWKFKAMRKFWVIAKKNTCKLAERANYATLVFLWKALLAF